MNTKTICAGIVGQISTDFPCKVIIIDDQKSVPQELKSPIKPFEIEPLIQESYVDFEFKRKKKPKNNDWQNRIKSLTNNKY